MGNKILVGLVLAFFIFPMISAGLGIKYTAQSALVNEGDEVCLNYYSVYNPWNDDTYVEIGVSPELAEIMTLQDTESVLVPAQTSSSESIPMKFCFKVPSVYKRDYAIAGRFIDKLECEGEMVDYSGEVFVQSVPAPAQISGTGGSTTQSSISAPLTIRVKCNPYGWNYVPIYVVLAILSAGVVLFILVKRNRTPKVQRDKEKLAKLKAEIAKAEGKKKKKKKSKK